MRTILIAAMLMASGGALGQVSTGPTLCNGSNDPACQVWAPGSNFTGTLTFHDDAEWGDKGSVPISGAAASSYLCKTGNDPACLTSAMGSVVQSTAIVFGNGDHTVTLHLDTGRVDYTEPPDKAARAFWEAVKTLMPLYVKCEAPDAH